MNYENFPEKLRTLPQWVMWKYEEDEKGRQTKILYSPANYKASTIKKSSWGTYEVCLSKLKDFNGIGFVFTKGIVGIDLDKCVEEGKIKQWAKDILNLFDSYTEFSPSKKGLHIICETDIEFSGHKKDWLNDLKEKEGIECYMRSRYFTVTGDVFENKKELKRIDDSKLLDWYKNTFEEKIIVQISPNISELPPDEKIIDFMRKARNGLRFISLFERGDFISQGFPSQSEADMSLASSLMFFCRNDTGMVDRIFRQSRLMRKKWDRADYRNEILKKCYRLQVMDWSKPEESDEPEEELIIRSMNDVVATNVNWLWHGRLAKGKLTQIQGDPGCGKSQITVYIASVLSKGEQFLDDFECEQGQTLFITAEDDAADTIKPRLMAQEANMDNVFELQWIVNSRGKTQLFNFEKHTESLRRKLKTLENLKLIVVDPISAFMGKIDSNSNSEVRGLLRELNTVAIERNCAVILITHNNKNTGQKALARASGSHAFGAACRMTYVCGLKPKEDENEDTKEEDEEFVIAPLKNNLTKNPSSFSYTVKSATVWNEKEEPIATSKIVWGDANDIQGQQIVDYLPFKKGRVGRPDEKYKECQNYLNVLLKNRDIIKFPETEEIRKELLAEDFGQHLIRKALSQLGYRSIVLHGDEVNWQKGSPLDDF